MKKGMTPYFVVSFLLIALFISSCKHYEGNFVEKTEAQLDQMERMDSVANADFVAGNYNRALVLLNSISKETERTVSTPLYQLEKTSVLLMQGERDKAHEMMVSFQKDLDILRDEKAEEKAKSVWHGENNKVFRGDPHELATFYGLLGLSFMERGEYEDAVRCFKNGILEDSSNLDKEKYDCDYALLQYLAFLASCKDSEDADAKNFLWQVRNSLKTRGVIESDDVFPPVYQVLEQAKECNVLLVVWAGEPPTVVLEGEYDEKRSHIMSQSQFDYLQFAVASKEPRVFPGKLGDINFQATTRGGRMMDGVRAYAASVKRTARDTRNVMIAAGYVCLYAGTLTMVMPFVSLGFLGASVSCFIIGGIAEIINCYANPRADNRYWKNLPAEMFVIPLKLPPGEHQVALRGYKQGDTWGQKTFTVNVPADRNFTVFHLPMMMDGRLSKANQDGYVEKLQKESSLMIKDFTWVTEF